MAIRARHAFLERCGHFVFLPLAVSNQLFLPAIPRDAVAEDEAKGFDAIKFIAA